jgi:hypothetical protein
MADPVPSDVTVQLGTSIEFPYSIGGGLGALSVRYSFTPGAHNGGAAGVTIKDAVLIRAAGLTPRTDGVFLMINFPGTWKLDVTGTSNSPDSPVELNIVAPSYFGATLRWVNEGAPVSFAITVHVVQ